MKKIGIIILVSALTFGHFLEGEPAIINETAVANQQTNEYPNMNLFRADGSVFTARDLPAKSILVIFFPDCDHCQREATEISSHIKAFKNYDMWFISSAPFADIERFSKQYMLTGQSNVHFVHTEAQDVLQNFGGIPTPSVFIYSSEKKLVKALKGETKIEEIIRQL